MTWGQICRLGPIAHHRQDALRRSIEGCMSTWLGSLKRPRLMPAPWANIHGQQILTVDVEAKDNARHVQDALNKVHVRVHEHMDGDLGMQPQPNNLITRMLVCHTQAGSIIGK